MSTRTARFAQFLRGAVEIKIKKVTEVNKYPSVLWFSELPVGLKEIRSPLISSDWNPEDFRWLVVSRVHEPEVPPIPAVCDPWLEDIEVRTPEIRPRMNTSRTARNGLGEEISLCPPPEVQASWDRYIAEKWVPWANRVKVVRQVKPIYQKLFDIYQELQGREDAYDVFIGVGLLYSRMNPTEPFRRHLLAFPAEISFDSRNGQIAVSPAADFVAPRLELEFLPTGLRVDLQRELDRSSGEISQLGSDFQNREKIREILTPLINSLGPATMYLDEITPQDAQTAEVKGSYAPSFIVRPRNARSLDALLERIEKNGDKLESLEGMSLPWRRLMEDARVWDAGNMVNAPKNGPAAGPRIYFPLPSNEEQSKIIRRAEGAAGAVVQGPPGTGKSHTIANLISHYLATGQRVLVTAQTAQALQVLRNKLPKKLAALCVSLFGAGSAGGKELEDSVELILTKRAGSSPLEFEHKAKEIEERLEKSERALAAHERLLKDARKADTEESEPAPGYKGTRACIARRLKVEQPALGWIEDEIRHELPCPIYPSGWEALAGYHLKLTSDLKQSLEETWVPLPFTEEDATNVLENVREAIAAAPKSAPAGPVPPMPAELDSPGLESAVAWLDVVRASESTNTPENAFRFEGLREAVLRHDLAQWTALCAEATTTLAPLTDQVIMGIRPLKVSGGHTRAEALRDITRLAEHYANGGRRRVLRIFTPGLLKETQWIEEYVQFDGARLKTLEELKSARGALEGQKCLDRAWEIWPVKPDRAQGTPRQQVAGLRERRDSLKAWLEIGSHWELLPEVLRRWLADAVALSSSSDDLLLVCRRSLADLKLAFARERSSVLVDKLKEAIGPAEVPPGIRHLCDGFLAEDIEKVRSAIVEHAKEGRAYEKHNQYVNFVAAVRTVAPMLARAIVDGEGTSSWAGRFGQFEAAWAHRCASEWLALTLPEGRMEATARAAADERIHAQDLQRELTITRAWHHAVTKISEQKRQILVGWVQAVKAIPQKGPNVFQQKAVARELLEKCLDAIPAWVVSLDRLYETVKAEPGLFDVAIVDEASQCWLDSLLLFYLAKKVIIVGDDKQISPTIVARPGDIVRLANAHLQDFEFRGLFTLKSSLFDHAIRYLGDPLHLQEHFRCVPEIIRFSNELCYRNHPLIPLRQCGRDRLEPLKKTYLQNGLRLGDINEVEAQAVVEAIVQCDQNPSYDESYFGVICLQGNDQAARIQQLLLERLGPGVFKRRNLRCGNAYAFQGDERDVMFLSMVAAPNVTNGTLTRDVYEQRFNVAMSRARDQMWLFHSVQEDDLSPECLRRKTLSFFYQPLDQTINGVDLDVPTLRLRAARADRMIERAPAPFDSWFEVDVALALVARNYRLSAQVKAGNGKRIDLVVEGSNGVRLAVECDGDVWHGPEQYQQDQIREGQLKDAGWHFCRVRECVFYSDETRAIREVDAACQELGIEPGGAPSPELLASSVVAEGSSVLESTVIAAAAPDEIQTEGGDESEVEHGGMDAQGELLEMESTEPHDAEGYADEPPDFQPTEQRDGPYTGYTAKDYPDPRTAPPANVRDAVLDIVQIDGPLPKAAVYALYRNGCARTTRAGRHLAQVVDIAISSLERMKQVVVLDEGGRRNPADIVVRTPEQPAVIIRARGARTIDGIPLSELAAVIRDLSNDGDPELFAREENQQRRVLEKFGFRYLSQRARSRLTKAGGLIVF